MKPKSTVIILSGLACLLLIVLIGFIATQYFDIASMKKALAGLTQERDMASSVLKTREDEIKGLQQRLKNLNDQITQAVDAEKQTNEQMDTLGRWLGKVSRLKNYLQQHPEYAIADMKFLTTKDWLGVTKSDESLVGAWKGDLQNEAQYRYALAELRLKAKAKTQAAFAEAVADFPKANDGRRPQSLEDIIEPVPRGNLFCN